jgi:aryl-alcohol dehydrogenase-like predicted oxidoreductase
MTRRAPALRALGRTGLSVSEVGLGAGPLGDLALGDAAAERVIRAALDLGINVIDTAPSYGASEERIGRALEGRRYEVVLVTKGGYGIAGVPDWTPEVLIRGIDRALTRLRTDHLDVFLLHSRGRELLARGDLFEPLVRARAWSEPERRRARVGRRRLKYGRAGSIFPHLASKEGPSAHYFRGLSYNKDGNRT